MIQLYNYEKFLPHIGYSSETSKVNSGLSSDAKHLQLQQACQYIPLCSAKVTDIDSLLDVHWLRSANQNRTRTMGTFYEPKPGYRIIRS